MSESQWIAIWFGAIGLIFGVWCVFAVRMRADRFTRWLTFAGLVIFLGVASIFAQYPGHPDRAPLIPKSANTETHVNRLTALRQQSLDDWRRDVDARLEQQPAAVRQSIKLAFEAGYDRAIHDVAEVMPKEK